MSRKRPERPFGYWFMSATRTPARDLAVALFDRESRGEIVPDVLLDDLKAAGMVFGRHVTTVH